MAKKVEMSKRLRGISDEKLIEVCQVYFEGWGATETSKLCNARWQQQASTFEITREEVYKLIILAIERGFIHLCPPENLVLGQRVSDRFKLVRSDVKVVAARKDLNAVAAAAARIALQLIEILGKKKKRVHLGLGAGHTTRLIAQHLAAHLRTHTDPPPLTVHAITAGFDAHNPQNDPATFLGYFQNAVPHIEYVGFPAPPQVDVGHFSELKERQYVKPAFDARRQIDIVITSLGRAADKHTDYNRFLELGATRDKPARTTRQHSIVGDVQYNAYSTEGPVHPTSGGRAVTIFDLDELTELSEKRDKYVLLVSGPCGVCRKTRTEALRPLVENPALKCWTQLVLDMDTAEELVGGP